MMLEEESCFPNAVQGFQNYSISEDETNSITETHSSSSLLYSLSMLKDKVHQVESVITLFLSQDQAQVHPGSSSLAIDSINSIIQDIILTASSMLLTSQPPAPPGSNPCTVINPVPESSHRTFETSHVQEFYHTETTSLNWYAPQGLNNGDGSAMNNDQSSGTKKGAVPNLSPKNYDIVEIEVADLLAKYTHYCQVCGKGFKRDANLRMHMRAHGDEYKTSAALSNPMKDNESWKKREDFPGKLPRKFSCPQEGCRWNQKHAKFQPLKSMICVKNHYKRSHCPKMYVCKRCNSKQFSVLSDLRTHEKHCGDMKWQCSCGTTFSRKDKLVGHVALFVGHSPLISVMKQRKSECQTTDLQLDRM